MTPGDAGRRRYVLLTAGLAAALLAGACTTRTAGSGRLAADAAGTTGPAGAASSPAGPTSAPPPTASGTGGSAAPTGSASPAEFAGVRLPLPAGWRLVVTTGFSGLQEGCVLAAGSRSSGKRPQDCAIVVRAFQGWPPPEGSADAPYFFADADAIGGFADDAESGCPGGDEQFSAPVRQQVTIGGRAGQYDSVGLRCATGPSLAVQQWAFTDYPNVVLTSYAPVGSAARAAVRGIVQGATLPTGTGTRTTDFGELTGYRAGPGGTATVLLDREVAASPFGKQNDDGSPADENDNPKTYPLRLAPDVLVRSAIGVCQAGGATVDDGGLGTHTCAVGQLKATLANGPAGPVWIKYDEQGQVAAIVEAYRP